MAYKLNPENQQEPYGLSEIGEDAGRLGLQSLTGALAAVPGTFGNIGKIIKENVADPLYKATYGKGVPLQSYEESAGKILPTTKQHIENIEKGIPYLKPKNRAEEFARETMADATELFLPGRIFKMGKYAFGPTRSLAISAAAHTAGEGTFQWTGDKNKADMVKNGTMLLGSLVNPRGAKDVAKSLYKDAENLLPQGAVTTTTTLNRNLSSLRNKILNGRTVKDISPNEKFVIDEIEKVSRNTSSGNVDISTLQSMKRSLNDVLKNHLYEVKDAGSRKGIKSMAKSVNKYLNEALEGYGRQNPEWWKTYKSAENAHGAVEQSNFISRILEKFLRGKPEALSHLFGVGIPAGLVTFSGPGAALTITGYQTAKILTRMMKSRELAKHYGKVLGAAAADNPELAHKELDAFEKELEKKNKNKYKLKSQR